MTERHALITGGAGFIGSHLTDTLIARGFTVTVLDDLRPQVHADAPVDANGWPIYLNPLARRIHGTVLDEALVASALDGITHLVHLAASVGVGQSMTDIVDYTRNNAVGAATILQVLSQGKHHVRRIAVASSMSIYGEGAYRDGDSSVPIAPSPRTADQLREQRWELRDDRNRQLAPVPTKEEKPLQPGSIYAINKRDHEEMFLAVGRALDIPTIALRLFNAYGSRQALSNPYTGVAAIFIARLLNDAPPLVFEDGEQRRDFVHVADVADAFATVLESDLEVWDSFNVGSGRSITVAEIARTLARLLGKNIAPDILGRYRVGDIRHCFADVGKIEETFGFIPKRGFEDGMAELIEWVRTTETPPDRTGESMAALERGRLLV
ncbi:MAG: NAD-dependent epimerase/dehydratase family protein [Sphingomonas sp.]